MVEVGPVSSVARESIQEVDTEYEEDKEEEEELEEVEEELDSQDAGDAGQDGNNSTDYVVPEQSKEVWKNFGCDTEAGRMLRRLYSSGSHVKDASSRVSYPRLVSPARRWEPKSAPRKPCPQRAPVNVPKAPRRSIDPDDPRYWRVPVPCRKPASEIFAEMEEQRPQKPNLPEGRDQAAVKRDLQDRFRYCGGKAMPEGAMGHVPKGELPPSVVRPAKDHATQVDENGMTEEHREIFLELTRAVQYKQARLAELDRENAAEPKASRAKTNRNKEALQLQNDIQRCLTDIDTLLAITE
mmetsp:Transcript_61049/g.101319  ORF Transcript_61049/g.101319 Transcript_61049/m.101319 type:complete len:297 (+) Transcript_61049:86-976(+)